MAVVVSLRGLVDELQMLPDEGAAYLNKATGRIITVTDDDIAMVEMDSELEEDIQDGKGAIGDEPLDPEAQFYQDVKRILASDPEYLKLPSRFQIHDYEIMEGFCLSVPDGKVRDILLRKIRGSGAFRRFKDTIYQYGIENDWFKYRDEAYKEIVIAWLESEGIAYTDDVDRQGQSPSDEPGGQQPLPDLYYDRLAPYYKYVYSDWDSSVRRQAQALDGVIREFTGQTARTVLDAACGIGTQSIGLAALGYKVTASDLSAAEIEHARQEASRQGLQIEFTVADMRQVWNVFRRQFDVVIACDNSVPHLLSDGDILTAFRQFYECTRPGGCCIITVRDYARLEREDRKKQIYPRSVHPTEYGQVVMFDVWDFEGDYYDLTTYLVEDKGESIAQTRVIRGGRYYCVEIPALERSLREAGFRDVKILRDRFFQPLLIAIK